VSPACRQRRQAVDAAGCSAAQHAWALVGLSVSLLAALVVLDHPPSAFICDEGVVVVKERNGKTQRGVG
jgi:hypothetical protein